MALLFVLSVLVLVCALLTAAGLYLAGIGVWFFVEEGEIAGGMFSLTVAALVLYGAYLFGRAAWRTRRERVGSAPVRGILTGSVLVAAGMLAWPAPTEIRVIGVITVALLLPLLLAEEFEPPKRR